MADLRHLMLGPGTPNCEDIRAGREPLLLPDEQFAAELSEFFTDLLSKQEPLGEEFERVLFENLDELYQN